MSKIGYIRVSTEHQETARQQEIMCDYQVDRIFSEKISGANKDHADRLVWVEPFEDTAYEKHSVVYIRYEEVPDGEYRKVDKWEIADNYDVERR